MNGAEAHSGIAAICRIIRRMPATEESEPLLYWIDSGDRIVAVNDAWNEFAVENGAAELTREHVLGRSLWNYIADRTTKELCRSLIARTRQSRPMDFAFRCDSPSLRRLMHMTIAEEADGRVRFQSAIARQDVAQQFALWDHSRARSGQPVRACSWCKKLEVGEGHWIEVDVAVDVLGLLAEPSPPPVTHATCPSCHETMKATLDTL